jgi:hypothetical protein
MHPFLNTSKLTLEEIVEKINKANLYLNQQASLGHNPTVLSIQEVIKYLEEEKNTRMQKLIDDEMKKKAPDAHAPLEVGSVDKVDIEKFIRNAL